MGATAIANSAKPTIVIVPGSFSPASFYVDVVDGLRSHGYETLVETLPSTARSPIRGEKAATMQEDADLFRERIEKLVDKGKDVVIMTHSYGGVPGTECSRGLSKKEQSAAGKSGGVTRLVYVTSTVPIPGKSLKDMMDSVAPFITVEGDFMSIGGDDAARCFSDIAFEEAKEWVTRMPYHSTSSYEGKLSYAGYKTIPVSWIFCEKDTILSPEFQRSAIEGIEKESGKKVDVHYLDSGHCPNISCPQELASIVAKAVAAGV